MTQKLLDALIEIAERLAEHPCCNTELSEDETEEEGGDVAELSMLWRIATNAIKEHQA